MDTRVENENIKHCKGEISDPPLWGRYAFEKQAAAFYTGEAFSKFQGLLRDSTSFKLGTVTQDEEGLAIEILHPKSTRVRMVKVGIDETTFTCSCNMYDRDGLLCPHILKVFTNRDIEKIPEKYLLRRWSKEAIIKISKHTSQELSHCLVCQQQTSSDTTHCAGR